MRTTPNANPNKVIIALKRCIVDTFDDSKWLELSYLTDSEPLISQHPRLLRSLYFGDEDYEGNVLRMIPKIINDDLERLRIVEDYVSLDEWLKNADPSLHAELYDTGEDIALDAVVEIADHLDIIELNKHAARIRNSIRDDPEQAIGSAKDLLESVLKSTVGLEGERSSEDIHDLLKLARKELGLNPEQQGVPGQDTIVRTLSNLGQIVIGVGEVRNLYGTGHGRYRSKELDIVHARLVVNAAVTVASYLLEIANERNKSSEPDDPPW